MSVDIVVNNHNYGGYVSEAVESACSQDHPAVRVIVVDDGSTDDSRERLEPFADRVELVFKRNEGQASALNAGFDRVRADAVMFLDADDRLAPNAASLVAAAFARDPAAARVYFQMRVIDAAGRAGEELKPPQHERMAQGDLRHAALTFPFDFAWTPMSGNGFRTAALRRICPIPLSYGRWGADWYLVHLTNLLGPVVYEPTIGAYYRMHGDNAHEPRRPALELESVRKTIAYQQTTLVALAQLGDRLGLAYDKPILSVTNVGHRLISLKLDPAAHPVADDSLAALAVDVVHAAARRCDIGLSMKLGLVAWFWAIAAGPRSLAAKLAELFLYPERRARLSGVVGRLQRQQTDVG